MTELIEKEAALKLVSDPHNQYHRIVKEFLLTVPTIEAEPVRHGRWTDSPTGNTKYKYCSECGGCMFVPSNRIKFCPYCGAKMDAEDTNVLANDGGAENG